MESSLGSEWDMQVEMGKAVTPTGTIMKNKQTPGFYHHRCQRWRGGKEESCQSLCLKEELDPDHLEPGRSPPSLPEI